MQNYPDLANYLGSVSQAEAIIALDEFIENLCEHGDEIENLTEPQKIFFYNQRLETEVNNGGFDQYFFNSTGRFAHETVHSLRAIGADKTADILQLAISEFPGQSVPKDRQKRVALMQENQESMEAVWEDLTNVFYEYEEDLNSLNFDYIRQNIQSF